MPLDLRKPRTEWLEPGEEIIRRWFEASDSVRVASIRGGDADRMIDNCISSFCSPHAFSFANRLVKLILKHQGWKNLHGRRGAVFGCDWGFTALFLAERWSPDALLAVDVTGKYAYAAREIQERFAHLEPLQRVELIETGPWGLKKFNDSLDFLVVTKSFGLLNSNNDRKELFKVAAMLKPGGALLYYPPAKPGAIRLEDYPQLLDACGFDRTVFLRASGKALPQPSEDARFILATRSRRVEQREFDAGLKRVGQDPDSLIRRRGRLEYREEDIVERIAHVRDQIQAGRTTLDSLPLRYTLNVISVCNIKCIFCDYPDRLRHWTVPETLLGDIKQTLRGTLRMQITGGEPLLNRTAIDVIADNARMPFTQMEIISNLTMPPKRELMEKVSSGASFLTCSIDAATRETYDRIRQDSNWDHVMGNLGLLTQIERERGRHYPHLQINFIILGHNTHEIAEFMDRAAELEADSVAYKWLLWTLTPRITEEARFDFNDDEQVNLLCTQIIEAHRRRVEYGIPIDWGPVPHHIKSERPDLYDHHRLDDVFSPRAPVPWVDPKRIFSDGPRQGADSERAPDEIDRAVETLDEMPDGLMPCAAPFTTLQINGPEHANFCCYSTPEYRAIPIDSSGSLLDAWNSPRFVEARRLFSDGCYEKVCRPHCSLYREYLARKARHDRGESPVDGSVDRDDSSWQTLDSRDPERGVVTITVGKTDQPVDPVS